MKNPLIPMGAITGNPTKTEIDEVMHLYAQVGIEQFLIYPRSGCEIEYMSERWIELCRDIIEAAKREKIDIWLYDEYNWPSGTCRGKVMRENEEYYAKSVFVEGGKCVIKKNEEYADILNADAVDCFIKNTHEVYYQHFGEYFGTVIKGIFALLLREGVFTVYKSCKCLFRKYPCTFNVSCNSTVLLAEGVYLFRKRFEIALLIGIVEDRSLVDYVEADSIRVRIDRSLTCLHTAVIPIADVVKISVHGGKLLGNTVFGKGIPFLGSCFFASLCAACKTCHAKHKYT